MNSRWLVDKENQKARFCRRDLCHKSSFIEKIPKHVNDLILIASFFVYVCLFNSEAVVRVRVLSQTDLGQIPTWLLPSLVFLGKLLKHSKPQCFHL